MLIIGEKLNSSIPKVREAINLKDKLFIQELAKAQVNWGADLLDINTALGEEEVCDMEWVINCVQEVVDIPICIDSTNPHAVKKGLETAKNGVMVNSISLETKRINEILPLLLDANCPAIALTTDDNGIPKNVESRLEITEKLVNLLQKNNYDLNNLYIDPLVLPLAVNSKNGVMFFKCLSEIKERFGVKTVSGLSNVSHSLPKRKLVNRHFLAICMGYGMDAAILDTTDQKLMTTVLTMNLLMDNDRFSRGFIKAYRNEQLAD